MNVFILDRDPVLAAQHQCDRHVVKMVLETAQLLCSIYEPGVAPYRRTHYNHPCAVWLREAQGNWDWLLEHGNALSAEYTHRYGKRHASAEAIAFCAGHAPRGSLFSKIDLTAFPQVMPEKYRGDDTVEAYRRYYRAEKARFAKWTRRPVPGWFREEEAQ